MKKEVGEGSGAEVIKIFVKIYRGSLDKREESGTFVGKFTGYGRTI